MRKGKEQRSQREREYDGQEIGGREIKARGRWRLQGYTRPEQGLHWACLRFPRCPLAARPLSHAMPRYASNIKVEEG